MTVFSILDKILHIARMSSTELSGETFTKITLEETFLNFSSSFLRLSKSSLKHLPSSVLGQLIFIS